MERPPSLARRTAPWEASFGGSRVVCGAGTLARLGEVTVALGIERPLVVTDPGLERAGWVERAMRVLRDAGLRPAVHSDVAENPDESMVERAAAAAREARADGLIGLGGGSAMDCAKGANFVLSWGGRMRDWRGRGRPRGPMLPSIGVPTTAGTGSEAQSYALISHDETHAKMACGADGALFRAVILDPKTVATAARETVAIAGLDAVSHAIEAHVSSAGNPLSRMVSAEAWSLLEPAYAAATGPDPSPDAWADLQVGAFLAGAAIELSMLGAAHACANPLTARHGVTHGVAVALMLPAAIRFNATDADPYTRLAASGAELADRVEELRRRGGLPASLAAAGVPRDALPGLAAEAAEQWTAGFNPRPVGAQELLELYERTA